MTHVMWKVLIMWVPNERMWIMLRRAGTILAVAAVLLMLAVASGLLCDGPGGETETYMSVTCDAPIFDDLTIDASILARPEWATINTDDGTQYAEPANETQAGGDARASMAILSECRRGSFGSMRAGPHYDGLSASNASGYVTWDGGRQGAGVRARA